MAISLPANFGCAVCIIYCDLIIFMSFIDGSSMVWSYLSPGQKDLIIECEHLLVEARTHPTTVTDFSYVVFPLAKAYEGFLKQVFLDLGFITKDSYFSEHFRIGRGLNPHLEQRLRHESVYDKVVKYCGGRELADELWAAWKRGRNQVFHYFPHNLRAISLVEAEEIIAIIIRAMEHAVKGCKIRVPNML